MALNNLKKNNPNIEIKDLPSKKATLIRNAWNDSTFAFLIPKDISVPPLSNIVLFEEFNSFYNKKTNLWEFIYTPEKKDNKILQRSFEFNYNGDVFFCYFAKSSNILNFFAKHFIMLKQETNTSYRNLRQFKDYFITDKPDYVKEYFKDRLPYSFYIKGNIDNITDKIKFAKTLNFYLTFYDRNSPTIQIFNDEKIENLSKTPCYTLIDTFPKSINSNAIDNTLLDILNVAHKTSDIRLEFIFYYQILEYCSYYFIEQEDDFNLRKILKQPDINYNADSYIKEILEVLNERFNVHKTSDKVRLDKTIKNYCRIKDIQLELEQNEALFSKDIEFDGGLKIKALFKDKSAIESNGQGVLDQAINNITKIRNVIVHLRESRENTVILPTERNNINLQPYLYLAKRIAEKIALQYN
ncbi:hypothetical protein [Myroides odoratus]|uniref:Uncharacterized protein n=1 Tax=Myroides odoratus TaxID=256 RepID=A0A378RLB1_MYROD|nr:hypothetical protein [Myroides odoratus]QQU04752.1 hypothetical protein I6I89_05535 [Myroides odoratus]STZ27802.1 Uncharacterised protein [Myroides odoratus]